MAIEINRAGIPVTIISALTPIPLQRGVPRIVRGVRIEHTLGDPTLARERDAELRKELVLKALKALETPVEAPTLF